MKLLILGKMKIYNVKNEHMPKKEIKYTYAHIQYYINTIKLYIEHCTYNLIIWCNEEKSSNNSE